MDTTAPTHMYWMQGVCKLGNWRVWDEAVGMQIWELSGEGAASHFQKGPIHLSIKPVLRQYGRSAPAV